MLKEGAHINGKCRFLDACPLWGSKAGVCSLPGLPTLSACPEPGSTPPAREKFPCALALRLSIVAWQNWEPLFLKGRSVRVSDLKVTWLVNGSTRARTCSNVLQLIQKKKKKNQTKTHLSRQGGSVVKDLFS